MQNLTEYILHSANKFPDKTAVSDGEISYSYKELYAAVIALSKKISKQLGLIYPDRHEPVPIGIIARHDTYFVLSLWSVLFAGAYYIPIDPKSPKDKFNKIIGDSNVQIILGRSKDLDMVSEGKTIFLAVDEAGRQTDIDTNPVKEDFDNKPFFNSSLKADSFAYMIYTSGSTGDPKGIIKSHGAVIDFIESYMESFDFSSDEIIGCQTPFFFDASAKDIFLSAALGATLEIIPDGMFTLPPALIRYLNEKKVSFISWVPSALSVVAQLNTFDEVIPETVKKIFFVGESFPVKHFMKWQNALPDAEFVNLYGASELSGICLFFKIPKNYEPKDRIPIGKPLKNCEVLLINDTDGRPVNKNDIIIKQHKTGEIYISSKALFSGYFNDPEETKNHFSRILGKTFFRTGDLAWYDENHDLNFASRNDSQIKHMGQRIELGEIETICQTLDIITKACCLYNNEKKKIYLFCELAEGASEDQKSILIKLKSILSSYMMPQKVIIKEKLPLNANGKCDRQLLMQEM